MEWRTARCADFALGTPSHVLILGSGGAVFATGSIAWAGAMAWNGYDNEVSRLTLNVLKRLGRHD